MRVLVYEHLCSLPGGEDALRPEGWAMLSAVLADLCACPGVEPVTSVEPSLLPQVQAISPRLTARAALPGRPEQAFHDLACGCEFALVIAPEFDDILATRAEWARAAGCRLLGPPPEVIRLCADKYRLGRHFREHEVPAPRTERLGEHDEPFCAYPLVVKPCSGAGAQQTYRIDSPLRFREQAARPQQILQPFCPGQPASVAVLAGPHQQLVLPPAEQRIDLGPADGRMSYAGGAVRFPPLADEAASLARRVLRAIPGLCGYFGIDLVLAGADSVVIEINPRLTTSYVGLRRLAKGNLMQLLLDVVAGKPVSPPTWHDGAVRFSPDGKVYGTAS